MREVCQKTLISIQAHLPQLSNDCSDTIVPLIVQSYALEQMRCV